MTGVAAGAFVVSALVPPAAPFVLLGALAVEGGTLAIALPAKKRFDGKELAAEVDRLHAVAVIELP